ncbi:hypothetical protein DIPPA_09710 [Diplonema papillatum]|nr:hypothetical protein DIPPA_09710 [Diplonema papillatum]
MAAATIRRAWLRSTIRAQRRFARDPLSLDDEPEDHEEAFPADEAPRAPRARKVYSFGSILNGRTGINVRTTDLLAFPLTAQKPTHISFFDDFQIKKVVGYHKHYFLLTECGRVFAWGSNNSGQLGCGEDNSDRHAPVLVRKADGSPLTDIVDVSAGKYHSAAVDSEGRVFTWGFGGRRDFWNQGHLLGQPASKGLVYQYQPFASPLLDFGPEGGMEVESPENPFENGKQLNPKAVMVSCGAMHTLVLDSLGRAWTWGYGEWGRLGLEDNEDRRRPTPVVFFLDEKTGLPRIPLAEVNACESVSGFLTTEGAVYVSGRDASRQLGFGVEEQGLRTARFEAINTPHNLQVLKGISQLAFGSHSALALNKSGTPYFWGGQETKSPRALQEFGLRAKQKIAKVAVGSGLRVDHRAFITTDGFLYLSGANLFGQCLADTRPRDAEASTLAVIKSYLRSWQPTQPNVLNLQKQMPEFFSDKKVVDVALGHSSTIVVVEELPDEETTERAKMLEEIIEDFLEAEKKKGEKGSKGGKTVFGTS